MRLLTRSHILLAACSALAAACGTENGPEAGSGSAALALGDRHACRTIESGTYCWGMGGDGQLGIGTTPEISPPVRVGGAPDFIALTAGSLHTCGLAADGTAWCWGRNSDGQLGIAEGAGGTCGAFACVAVPTQVAGGIRFRSLSAGAFHTCGLDTGGAAWCWGRNDVGQLGTREDGDSCDGIRCARRPVPVAGGHRFDQVSAAMLHVCAVATDGTLLCWGFQTVPVEGTHINPTFTPDAAPMAPEIEFRQVAAGGLHTCAIGEDDGTYCWGIDALGAGPTPLESAAPVPVLGGERFRSVASARLTSCALDAEAAAWCWGANGSGEVGTAPVGTGARFNEPSAVSGGFRFRKIAGGQGTYCGITTEETTVCWGRGQFGELGTQLENSTAPVPIAFPEPEPAQLIGLQPPVR